MSARRERRSAEQAQQRKSTDAAVGAARLGRLLDPDLPIPPYRVSSGRATEIIALLAPRLGFEQRPVSIDDSLGLLEQARMGLQASSVRTRPLTLSEGWWRNNVPPMVVLHDDSLAVVLPGRLFAPVLRRPGHEPERVTADVAARIAPAALEVFRPLPDRPVTGSELIRFGMRGTRFDLGVAVAASLGVGLVSLAVPIATSVIFNEAVPRGNVPRIAGIIAVLILLSFISAALAYTSTYHLIRISDAVEVSTSSAVLDRVLRTRASVLRRWSSAQLSSRVLVASTLQDALLGAISIGLMALILAVLNGILLIVLIPPLGIVGAGIGVALVLLKLYLAGAERRRKRLELDRLDDLNDVALGLLRGWTPLRMTDGEVGGFARWAEVFGRFRRAFNRRWGLDITTSVITTAGLGVAGLSFVLIAYRLPEGTISAGTYLAFTSAFAQFSAGVTGLILTIGAFTLVGPLIERLNPLLENPPESDVQREHPGVITGEIAVRRLSFRYDEDLPWVLRDVSFTAPAGSFVGVVGTSGSGKSTLLRLLLGFEAPRSGVVMYDDADLEGLDLGAVRRQFGVVLQSSLLLPGTLRDNITVSSGRLPEDRVWALLEQVDLADMVREMPLGLDTVVDEGSTILSGGQRQRILLARALAHGPAELFLDEATSALDNLTQEAVTRNVAQLGVTRVVIAHRLSTIRLADQIIVLDEGMVAESGTYDELVARQGLFAALVERQEL